jgi:hypothetical protein
MRRTETVQTKKMTPENHLLKRVFSRTLFDENNGRQGLIVVSVK